VRFFNIAYSQAGYNSITNYTDYGNRLKVLPGTTLKANETYTYTLPTATLTPVNKYSYSYEYINGN
jgi:hypothetical protein